VAVVISDFEVVVEPPGETAPPADAGPDSERPVMAPRELELLLEWQAERAARVRAH
jgi:hypothetical protein